MTQETTKSQTSPEHLARVLFDVDGVIADYTQLHVNAVNASGVRSLPSDWKSSIWDIDEELGLSAAEKEKVWEYLKLPGMAASLAPLPGAVDAVKRIAKVADVYFVTGPLHGSPTWSYDRGYWLTSMFGWELGSKLVLTHEKHVVAGDYLVDDKVEFCLKWAKYNPLGTALRWCQPGMKLAPDLINISDWSMLETFVDIAVQRKRTTWR